MPSIPSAPFGVSHPDYTVSRLTVQDADALQRLFETCGDFFELTNGMPPIPTAARDEFSDVPDGKSPQDIHAFGLVAHRSILVGVIIAVQHYPDAETWWIGLMLLAPEHRGQGIGAKFYRAFEQWLAEHGVVHVSLCAIAPNHTGRQFWQQMGFEVIRRTASRPYGCKTHVVYVYRRTLPAQSG